MQCIERRAKSCLECEACPEFVTENVFSVDYWRLVGYSSVISPKAVLSVIHQMTAASALDYTRRGKGIECSTGALYQSRRRNRMTRGLHYEDTVLGSHDLRFCSRRRLRIRSDCRTGSDPADRMEYLDHFHHAISDNAWLAF